MYSVSDEYKAAMKQQVQRFRMTGTAGDLSFSDENILSGSFHLTNQCSDDTNVSIGSVYIGELKVTFMKMPFVRQTLDDMVVKPSLGLLLPAETYEDVPLGIFHVSEANWGESGVEITAYDNMARFEKTIQIDNGSKQIYDFLIAATNACGVPLGMEQTEVEALPNGTEEFSVYPENDMETWRDLIAWCAMTTGTFATINRDGALVLRLYSSEPVDTIDISHRFSGGKFSDFITRYTGLSIVNIADQATKYYGLMPDDGLTFNMGSNPLMQYGLAEVTERQRLAVLNAMQAISYVPMEVSMIGSPVYDLGDVLLFTGGIAGDSSKSCITKYDWTYNGTYKATGVGQNPALVSAKSKVDKNIAGLLSTTNADSIYYYSYVNADEITIGDGNKGKIIDLKYATQKATYIEFHAEIKLRIDTTEVTTDSTVTNTDGSVTVTYYMNGEEVKDYYPVETLQDGTHLLHLQYIWKSTANLMGNFAAWISMAGASLYIEAGSARAYLVGQGLAGEGAWDGSLSAEDEVLPADLSKVFHPFTDTVTVTMVPNNDAGVSDIIPAFGLSSILRGISGHVGNIKFLYRYDTLHDDVMTYDHDAIEIKDGAWKLKDTTSVQEIESPDEEATEILSVSADCDSNNVNFLASFDHGETWWSYENGWTEPDTTRASYGMFGPAMKEITKEEWAEKLTGSIKIKAIIHKEGTLTDIQIFLKEVKE